MDFNYYLATHNEKSLPQWKINSDFSVVSPIKNQEVFIDDKLWFSPEGLNHSELLWLYSLGAQVKFYHSLITGELNTESITIVEELLDNNFESFLNLQNSENNKFLYVHKYSYSHDHCVAVRMRYLCMLIAMGYPNVKLIKDIIKRDLQWFSELDSVSMNNHGMMVCVSILHARLFFDEQEIKLLADRAISLLKSIVEFIIPNNYYAKENTIAYHNFYIRDLTSFLRFTKDYMPEENFTKLLDETLKRMNDVLLRIVYPSGEVPPIGQSGLYGYKFKSIPGKSLFKDQGFFVLKDNKNYFSYTCGFSTTIHKQVDDTSFTLRLSGVDIIVDCGLGSYDAKDTKAVVINGQRGHSGAFFKKFDDWTMQKFHSSGELSDLDYSIDERHNQIVSSKSFSHENLTYQIQRTINILSFYDLNIKDVFVSDDSFAGPVSRFIFDGFRNFKVVSNRVTMESDLYRVSVLCWNPASFSILSSYDGDITTSIAFRSLNWNEYKSVNILEITPLEGELEVNISIESLEK